MLRSLLAPLAIALLLLLLAIGSGAQTRAYWSPQIGEPAPQRSGFTFCRLVYRSVRSEALGQGYATDFPMADQNLMIRLSELTRTPVTWYGEGQPVHLLMRATDPGLFGCPFLFGSDVGTARFNDDEVAALREYLLKGGFLWVDDFWGPYALENWLVEVRRILPDHDVIELPPEHPIFSTFYFVDAVPQIPSIQYWRSSGGDTSERGAQSAVARMYGVVEGGRILVLMSHNTDIADGWEREGEDYQFFHSFSPRGYAVGVNVAIWAMTH